MSIPAEAPGEATVRQLYDATLALAGSTSYGGLTIFKNEMKMEQEGTLPDQHYGIVERITHGYAQVQELLEVCLASGPLHEKLIAIGTDIPTFRADLARIVPTKRHEFRLKMEEILTTAREREQLIIGLDNTFDALTIAEEIGEYTAKTIYILRLLTENFPHFSDQSTE